MVKDEIRDLIAFLSEEQNAAIVQITGTRRMDSFEFNSGVKSICSRVLKRLHEIEKIIVEGEGLE